MALAISACDPPAIASVVPDRPLPIAPAGTPRTSIPAGAIFTARVDRALDSFHTSPGTPFAATVVAPLVATSGAVIVPYGARLTGYVASTGSLDAPRLVLAFTGLETAGGVIDAQLAVRSVQHVMWKGPFFSATAFEGDMEQPGEVYVPAGALMELVVEKAI